MRVKFATAIFGERAKAHSLLSSSSPDLAKALVPTSDLPLDLPDSAGKRPMFNGFCIGTHYVFLCTTRDANATRGGMAKSAALICDFEIVHLISSLGPIFQYLQGMLVDANISEDVVIDTSISTKGNSNSSAILLASLLNADEAPAVWIGEDGFCEAIDGVWRMLPGSLRPLLVFRYSCTPRDSRIKESNILVTPIQLKPRWTKFNCLSPTQKLEEINLVLETFVEDSKRYKFFEWSASLSVTIDNFKVLRQCIDTYLLFEKLEDINDLELTVLFRNIALLCPSQYSGMRVKSSILNKLQSSIKHGPLTVINYLRNIDAIEYKNGATVIETATRDRVVLALTKEKNVSLQLALQAIRDKVRPWALGFVNAFEESILQNYEYATDMCWNLMISTSDGIVSNWVENLALRHPELENILLRSIPADLSPTQSEVISGICQTIGWSRLHASTIPFAFGPDECITHQLQFIHRDPDGMSELSNRLGSELFLKTALNHPLYDKLLQQIISGFVENNDLLKLLVLSSTAHRKVFTALAALHPNVINGSGQLDHTIDEYWDLHLSSEVNDTDLLTALANTKHGNLLHVKNRQRIWETLPADSRRKFLDATAIAWIERTLTGFVSEKPEPLLCSEILSQGNRMRLLSVNSIDESVYALNMFEMFEELTSTDFDEWRTRLLTRQGYIPESFSRLLGNLIRRREWTSCANALMHDYDIYKRKDLHPALCECSQLFSWPKRIWYSLSNTAPTVSEWWSELENVLVYLYSSGPLEKNIWERAGGNDGDIRIDGSGREQWGRILRDMSKGASFEDLSLKSLLKECVIDYPNNADLRLLVDNRPESIKFK